MSEPMKELIADVLAELAVLGIEAKPGELVNYAHSMCMALDDADVPRDEAWVLSSCLVDESCMDSLEGWLRRMGDFTVDDAAKSLEESVEFYRAKAAGAAP